MLEVLALIEPRITKRRRFPSKEYLLSAYQQPQGPQLRDMELHIEGIGHVKDLAIKIWASAIVSDPNSPADTLQSLLERLGLLVTNNTHKGLD
jgi:hypothetical protein